MCQLHGRHHGVDWGGLVQPDCTSVYCSCCITDRSKCQLQGRHHGVDWGGRVHFILPGIDADPESFILGEGRGRFPTLIQWLRERTKHLDTFLFPPITERGSISDVLFTGGRGVSDFSVVKYY